MARLTTVIACIACSVLAFQLGRISPGGAPPPATAPMPLKQRSVTGSAVTDDTQPAVAAADGSADGPATLAPVTGAAPVLGTCPSGYISPLLCRFIDIDFIEFVLSSHPNPGAATIVDIGVYQGGELVQMARQGFKVKAFEPNPFRHEKSSAEVAAQPEHVKNRITLNRMAVADQEGKLYFQRAGLDSHIYFPEDVNKLKPHTIIVDAIPIKKIVQSDTYFVKIDTQGFDTRIVDNLLDAIDETKAIVQFIQFEFSPHFEVTRVNRSAADHVKVFRRLIEGGYDVYMGAAVQPWIKSHRSQYGKTPLAMLSPAANVPTCVSDFVAYMHKSKTTPIHPGKTSIDMGSWMDMLAVRRVGRTPYYRHTGWVLSRHM